MARQSEQFNPADNIRKELDPKIEDKVSYHVFYWVFGILILVLGGIITYIIKTNEAQNKIKERLVLVENKNNKVDSINDRIVRLETQMESVKSK